MVYDGDGNRVSETVGGVTTQYLIDDRNPTGLPQVMDELVNGAVTRTYAYGLQRISENQLIGSTFMRSFYGYDGHGNVRFLTNNAGTVTDSYDYDAFGLPITSTGTTPNNYLYSGEQYDGPLGLYYLRARYYNPATGRFLVMDPYWGDIQQPATLHKYVLTADDPVNWLDPTGNAEIAEYDVLVAKNRGLGLQAHHLIPQRFARTLGAAYCTIAIELTPAEHLVFTNLWGGMTGGVLPYGGVYTAQQIFAAAKEVYWGFPKIQEAVDWCQALAEIP